MNNIITNIKKISIIEILLIIFLIIIIISLINSNIKNKKETFDNINKEFIIKNNNDYDDFYDDFYTNIYDILFYNKIKSDFEIGTIINNISPSEKSIILDIGSKTGYIVNIFKELTQQIIGIELSQNMINKAIERYPYLKNNFIKDDPLNNQLFQNNSFTHIFSLNLNFYHINNKSLFLQNCFNWLFPGGYLAIEFINNANINILEHIINIRINSFPKLANPNILVTDNIKFKDFIYYPKYYMLTNNKVIFEEKFKFNNGNIRKQETTIYFMSISKILKIAKYIGFIILKQFSINNNNYMYILQKPN